MLPPDVIDKLKREREAREKSAQIPLYIHVDRPDVDRVKPAEEDKPKRIVVIDLC